MMLKLKLQYLGHLMQRTDLLEKTPILGKIEGRRKRGRQGMRWLDGIIDSWLWAWAIFRELVMYREPGHAAIHGVSKSRTQPSTELNWCQGGPCGWYVEPILSYNSISACFTSYREKPDKISTMIWRFTFLFISVSFYITYFKSLLVVYIFKFFTLPSLIEHLNYEMALYEQNFLLRSILYFNDY